MRIGEKLMAVNQDPIADVLDYKYYTYDAKLELELEDSEGCRRSVLVEKSEGQDLGLEFDTYLMDEARSCTNKCIFCFIDQLPKGMRETMYFKDDDARLSFLLGNYITMTNLSQREIQRIIDLKISPVNISIHTTNPELRRYMLSNRFAGEGFAIMQKFANAGIMMNAQIVACPGVNDEKELMRTIKDLSGLYPYVASVSVVPVGITKYRQNLEPITPFTKEGAARCVRIVDEFGDLCLKQLGSRIFYLADELFLKAGMDIPGETYYEEFNQLENGVGMLRVLDMEFTEAQENLDEAYDPVPFAIATGAAAAPFLQRLIDLAAAKCHNVNGMVYPIVNDFFGHTIDVAGLITGGDIIKQLKGKNLGEKLIIPETMLRHGEDVFLDDVHLIQVEQALGVPVRPVKDGGGLLYEILNMRGGAANG